MAGGENCQFCLGPLSGIGKKTSKSWNQFHNYLYYRNVKETISSGVGIHREKPHIPKLTFSLSSEMSSGHDSGNRKSHLEVCEKCYKELEKLDKLHQQLVAVKKTIDAQVGNLNKIRKSVSKDENHEIRPLPKLEMSLAGAVVGKQNILQALKFLGAACDGMADTKNKRMEHCRPTTSNPSHSSSVDSRRQPDSPDESTSSQAIPLRSKPEQMIAIAGNIVKMESFNSSQNFLQDDSHDEPEHEGCQFQDEIPVPTRVYIERDPLEVTEQFENSDSNESQSSSSSSTLSSRTGKSTKGMQQPAPASRKLVHCKICRKVMKKKSLNDHMKTHTGKRSFQCEFCNKEFVTKANVVRHRRLHTGETPYPCHLCSSAFPEGGALQRHVTRVHGQGSNPKR